MKIAVYDVAADSGGALSILLDYYARALSDIENEYLFIVSTPNLPESLNVRVYRAPYIKRSWGARLRFDVILAHKIVREFGADMVLSLQNMIVPFSIQKQIVYMHNPLPKQICDLRFSFKDEPKMWVYQNVVGKIIIGSLKKADEVIVQTEWLKKRLVSRCGIDAGKINIERPDIAIDAIEGIQKDDGCAIFFYPASGIPFKNHEIVVAACQKLKARGISNYRVVLTLDGSENQRVQSLFEKVEREGLPIEFLGWFGREKMNQMYSAASCLLFPSKLETFGLPLMEAKAYGLDIIAANLEYAHETIGAYDRVSYFDPNDGEDLSRLMLLDILR